MTLCVTISDDTGEVYVVIEETPSGAWVEHDDKDPCADADADFVGPLEGIRATSMASMLRDARKYYAQTPPTTEDTTS